MTSPPLYLSGQVFETASRKIETETNEARKEIRDREKRGKLASRRAAIEQTTSLYESNARKYTQHQEQYLLITDYLLSILRPKLEKYLWALLLSLKVRLNKLSLDWNLTPPQERGRFARECEFEFFPLLLEYLDYSGRPRFRDSYALRNARLAIENGICYASVMGLDQHFTWLREKLIEACGGEEPDYWTDEKRHDQDFDL